MKKPIFKLLIVALTLLIQTPAKAASVPTGVWSVASGAGRVEISALDDQNGVSLNFINWTSARNPYPVKGYFNPINNTIFTKIADHEVKLRFLENENITYNYDGSDAYTLVKIRDTQAVLAVAGMWLSATSASHVEITPVDTYTVSLALHSWTSAGDPYVTTAKFNPVTNMIFAKIGEYEVAFQLRDGVLDYIVGGNVLQTLQHLENNTVSAPKPAPRPVNTRNLDNAQDAEALVNILLRQDTRTCLAAKGFVSTSDLITVKNTMIKENNAGTTYIMTIETDKILPTDGTTVESVKELRIHVKQTAARDGTRTFVSCTYGPALDR